MIGRIPSESRVRELLKMPLDDIENTVRVMKNDDEDNDALEDRDARVRRFRETVIRIGAILFRSRLMEAYSGRCYH